MPFRLKKGLGFGNTFFYFDTLFKISPENKYLEILLYFEVPFKI